MRQWALLRLARLALLVLSVATVGTFALLALCRAIGAFGLGRSAGLSCCALANRRDDRVVRRDEHELALRDFVDPLGVKVLARVLQNTKTKCQT